MSAEALAYLSSVAGIVVIWCIYEWLGYKIVSVSVPLIASYAFLVPDSLYTITVSFLAAFVAGEVAYRRFLFYGMRLFLLYSVVSSLIVFLINYPRIDVGILLISTLPGLLAYDVHSSQRRYATLFLSAIFFTTQLSLLCILVNFLEG